LAHPGFDHRRSVERHTIPSHRERERETVASHALYGFPTKEKNRREGRGLRPSRGKGATTKNKRNLSALVDLLLALLLPLVESGIGSGTGEPVVLDLLPDLGAELDLLGRLLLLLLVAKTHTKVKTENVSKVRNIATSHHYV
jgi:hypothetical protein